MKKYAVIVAAGSGTRMGSPVPKQFLLLQGKPVLWHTLEVFLSTFNDLEIVLVLPEEHIETGRSIIQSSSDPLRVREIAGGETRFYSVKNGLQCIGEESVIFVHDGVRCLVSRDLVQHCYAEALQFGSAIPVTDSRDSVRLLMPQGNIAMERGRVKFVQTPQTFLSRILLPAYQTAYQEKFTDEATVVEASGHQVHLVKGEPDNIKITAPVDLVLAEAILAQRH